MAWLAELGSSVLLFFLVFGMSATVELRQLRKQANNSTALLIGVCMQFMILPFIGFLVVKALQLPAAMGITLLVVTSSPGGSYSNWWCSLFNAELSLSVTMTAISTLLSTIMLPTNLILYARWTYSSAVVKSLDWRALFVSLVVVLSGISCGLLASARSVHMGQSSRFRRRANMLGNFAGISLITLSLSVSSSDHKVSLWNHDAYFYIGVALPAMVGLAIATYLATKMNLEKPERVAVAVESCYQNTGIATSVALTMFSGNEDELATAIGVPLLYGLTEAVLLALFCLVCWKIGWTKAPANENLCVVLYNSYEVEDQDREEMEEAIEVVLGADSKECAPVDLIFAQTEDGSYAVDKRTLDIQNRSDSSLATQDMTDASESGTDVLQPQSSPSRDGQRRSLYLPHGAVVQQRTVPSSPTDSSRSSVDDHDEDAAAMILAMEDENCHLQQLGGGRFGRTISTLRARATGYKHSVPASPDSQESDETESTATEARIPLSPVVPSAAAEEDALDVVVGDDDNHSLSKTRVAGVLPIYQALPNYHVLPVASPNGQQVLRKTAIDKQID